MCIINRVAATHQCQNSRRGIFRWVYKPYQRKTNAVNRIHGERCFPWMQDSCHTFRSTVIRDHLNFRDIRTKPRCRKNYWDRKEEIAARFGNASGFLSDSKSQTTTMEPADVDLEIPYTGINNANTFALIIANENYGKLSNVPFAVNDGNTFARYCQRTLGVPTKNILQYNDASYGSIREALSDIRLINDVVGNDMKLIVYYAGHGAPDDATLEPYLIPVDAARVNKDVCIPMAQFYQEIGSMKLKSATVFLDACFSGATRDGNMVIAARGIARVPKKQGLKGRVAVLSATSDDQTALPYNEKGHGMFTYYLLKCLKETKGEASLQDIKEYVTDNVKRNSSIVNRKEQTPTFNVSTEASSQWNAWKLNN